MSDENSANKERNNPDLYQQICLAIAPAMLAEVYKDYGVGSIDLSEMLANSVDHHAKAILKKITEEKGKQQ